MKPTERVADVIVIGAGAAGLAAARDLRAHGARVMVLEARDRIGGRVHSAHSPDLDIPIELGPEFIHGLAPETLALAKELRLPVVEVPAAHYVARGKRLSKDEGYFDELGAAMKGLSRRGPDQPVGERIRMLRSPRRRQLALEYVRGLQAVDPARASSVASAGSAPEGDQRRQLRLVTGYGPMIEGLARNSPIRLRRVVTRVRWHAGHVDVWARAGTRSEHHRARALIVTVPIGVLRAKPGASGAIALEGRFSRACAAIEQIAMGQVVRLVLHLDAPLGDLIGHPDASFVHTSDPDFPAWWSPLPMRTPIAVAWVGGPPARVIDDRARTALVETARRVMRRTLGIRAPVVHGAWLHDWRHDPFARGAYAYPLVGGAHAGVELGRPIQGTIFFAGEATSEKYPGTVEGALETGRAAARRALRALG